MAPKKQSKGKKGAKQAPKVYDYSGLEKGTKVQIESEGSWYSGSVVVVSTAQNRRKAPVKVTFTGYDKSYDEWVGGDRLRSKALKVKKPERKEGKKLEVTFGYWKIRGLGAVFRMIFEYKGVKYTDNQYADGDKWFKEDKPKILEKNPLANLPYIEAEGSTVCQTNACLQFLGKRLRMNGLGYKNQQLNEQLLCEIMDVRNAMIELVYPFKTVCRDAAEHKEKSTKAVQGEPFKKFEAVLEKNGSDYFCGKLPSICDFHIWEMLDQYKLLAEKHGAGDLFEKIPKCKAFYDRFRALPGLQKYFDSDDYKLPINNPMGGAYFS
jgi:glutathione S-transferase